MRLTLRTMLAYLDDVLDPADAQNIGKKIEESEFAATVVHRTRDCMRRLRLGAPKISGRGMGLDPNTVAEYLDNTLPDERVPDFEKVCLESDVHLAEVASCHQILALVLGEPADVDPHSRDRMYKLVERSEAAAAAAVAAAEPELEPEASSDVEPEPAARPERKKPEVPEYLREAETGRSWWGIAAAALLAVLFLVVLIMAIPSDGGSWLGRQLSWSGADEDANGEPLIPEGDQNAGRTDTAKATGSGGEAANAAKPSELKQPVSVQLPEKSATPVENGQAEPPLPNSPRSTEAIQPPPAAEYSPRSPATTVPAAAVPDAPPMVAGDAPAILQPTKPAATAANAKPQDTGAKPPEAAATPTDTAVKPNETGARPNETPAKPAETAVKPALPGETPATPPATPPATGPAEPADSVGRLISNDQVLVHLDPKTQSWQRLPAQEMVFAGDRLVSLPAFRSTMALTSGVTVSLLGGSTAMLQPPGPDGVPGLALQSGRLVALTAGKPNTRLRVQVGDRQAMVTFDDSGTTMALEVRTVRTEGTNPETQEPLRVVELYVASGKLTWQDLPDGKPEEVAAPMRVSLGAAGPRGNELPEWIAEERLTNSEKIGAEFMDEYLAPDKPTMLGLKELAEHRRAEVRTLAIKALAALGEFEPLVSALNQNDPSQRAIWADFVVDLRSAVARDPSTAAAVRLAFEKQRGDSAPELYRMLWGYTSDDLKAGAAAKLVDYLDHSDLDFRSLAYWNLRNLTGINLLYRPDQSAELRKPQVQKWRQRLASGQIVIKAETDGQ